MKRLVLFCSFLLVVLGAFAQFDIVEALVSDNPQPTDKVVAPTVKPKTDAEKKAEAREKSRKLIMKVDTLTSSDYMMSIERVNDKLNAIVDSAKLGFEVVSMGRKIHAITSDINIIRQNIKDKHSVVNVKNLYLYQSFTSNLDEENDKIQARLAKMYNKIYHAKLKIKTVMSDSVFRVLYADTALRRTFDEKLERLERKWAKTDSTTRAGVDSLNVLKVKAADNSITLANMLTMMDNRLDKADKQLLGNEVNFLWTKSQTDSIPNNYSKKVLGMVSSEQNAIRYYFSQTSQQRFFVLILAILLFVWLFIKRKQLKSIKQGNESFNFLNLKYLHIHPVLSLLVVLMCLMPFFDAYAPTSYIAIEYFILLTLSIFIFIKIWSRSLWYSWLILVGLAVVDTLTYLSIEPTSMSRLCLLLIHISIIIFSLRFYKKLTKETPYYKAIKVAAFTAITLASLAVICNVFGRFSLSGVLGIAAIYGITQALILPIFVETIIEVILLQLQSRRLKKGIDKPFDYSIVIKKIKIPFIIIAVILWFIMLSSNLNIYHGVSDGVVDFLTKTRTLGSISFELISVLMFFVIIWFAHILQRLISFLFGETGSETEDVTTVSKGQHSRLLVTRLLVLIGGYLLAIAASGLPIDKLTFLIGALGVGIGMGLQNIVNNFVSGIILIFDGSLQIGDEIEVNGQAGKVKEIGLRSSTLNTADGAEVIIPNGNILSQNIINWTFSNDQRRVQIEFSLSGKELDANLINELINNTIKNIPHVIAHKKPIILYTKVNQDGCGLKVHYWSTTSHVEKVKSEAMLQLNAAFADKGIRFE
jgi:small-conductance mechanosensitive channel